MEISQKGSQFTFENFKVTHNNSDAYEIAVKFSESGNKDPLCLIGRSGTGKTRLDKENNSSAIGKDTDITKISIVWNRNGETGEIEVYS